MNQRSAPDFIIPIFFISIIITGCSFSSGEKGRSENWESENNQRFPTSYESRFNGKSIPEAEEPYLLNDIYFEFGSAEITEDAQKEIKNNSSILKESELSIMLEGHTDSRGTTEYNLALGQQRALAVFTYLVSLGIPSSRLSIISYGENIPVARGDSNEARARNRRVHFSIKEPTKTIK